MWGIVRILFRYWLAVVVDLRQGLVPAARDIVGPAHSSGRASFLYLILPQQNSDQSEKATLCTLNSSSTVAGGANEVVIRREKEGPEDRSGGG